MLCDFVSGVFVVTEWSTGPKKQFRERNSPTAEVMVEVSLDSILSGTLPSFFYMRKGPAHA
jgi:hypothetical protein